MIMIKMKSIVSLSTFSSIFFYSFFIPSARSWAVDRTRERSLDKRISLDALTHSACDGRL